MRLLLTSALALAGCTSTVSDLAPSPIPSTFVAPVARSAAESTACARSLLTSFIDAFNRGDSAQLETFFSTTQGAQTFQWFVTPGTPAYGPRMSQLPQYFATWRAAGERWRLVNVDAGASPGWHGGVDFAMEIERAWPDRSLVSIGKGALDCDARTIFVFGLG
jgi:hypothetical protein